MENAYAQALLRLIDTGHAPADAVARVKRALESAGRLALFPRIARAVRRLAQKEESGMPRLYIASEATRSSALKEASAASSFQGDVPVVIDEALIGGWRYVEKGRLIDTTYKQQLLDMYHRATL